MSQNWFPCFVNKFFEKSSKITGICKTKSRDPNLPNKLCKLVQQEMLISGMLTIDSERYQAGRGLMEGEFVEGVNAKIRFQKAVAKRFPLQYQEY